MADLDRLGFDPLVTDSPDDADAAVIAFAHCPFADLAESIPSSSAACTGASSPASSPRWATPRSASSARSTSRTPCRVTVASALN